ncbi:restriction endonuclease subunit S [Acinetobacter pittii]|uniref:restriction endonuclease subunit S n=1 Tax=Acinetobacter pittii TaxID=48296 RepID=UPI0021D043C0|nr:restriction endonuclease subunit S [Acinetobacter pittii]MCU4442147.1 restriction endonuclease subunit S [Acinetobacter pittii]
MTIPVKKISTFCKTGSGGTPSRSNNAFFENGTIPWVKSGELKNRYITEVEEYITDLAIEKSAAKLVSRGSLLIAMYGATVGEVSQLTFDATTNQAICNIQPDENVCDVNYLYRFLEASKPYLLSRRVGGGQPNISQGVIKDLDVPLPPLAEQRRIASILDQAYELRQKRQQAIEKLDQLLQATFIDMFGDPVSNPKGWQVKKLSELSIKIHSGNTPKGGSENYVDQGIIFLRSQNVWKNKVILDDVAYIDAETHSKMMKSSVKHEDLLMTKTGRINTENSSLGRAAIYLGDDDSANINGHVYLIRIKDGFNKYFILRILTLPDYYEYIRSVCVGGIDKRQLNKEHIENFPIIQPPMELQNKFSDIVQVIESQKPKLLEQLDLAENLFQTLQQKAFSGTL